MTCDRAEYCFEVTAIITPGNRPVNKNSFYSKAGFRLDTLFIPLSKYDSSFPKYGYSVVNALKLNTCILNNNDARQRDKVAFISPSVWTTKQ